MEPKPDEKLDGFFECLSDMGLSDVEDLQDEPYSVRVIVKAMRKMKMFKTIPIGGEHGGLSHLVVSTIPSGFNFASFFPFLSMRARNNIFFKIIYYTKIPYRIVHPVVLLSGSSPESVELLPTIRTPLTFHSDGSDFLW